LQFPIPSATRCYKLGQALRRAIHSYPEDISVTIVATGGLSHQVHGERAGFNNTAWDQRFMELIENDPVALTELTLADYPRLGGLKGAEVIMWLVMRGALSANVRKVHLSYYLPTMRGLATAVYERYRRKIHEQLVGIGDLPGTYPSTVDVSVRAYRLNDLLHRLIEPQKAFPGGTGSDVRRKRPHG